MTGVALLCLGGCTQVWAVPALQEVKVNPLLADQLLLELSFQRARERVYRQSCRMNPISSCCMCLELWGH